MKSSYNIKFSNCFIFYAKPKSIPTIRTKNDTSQAIQHCIITIPIAAFLEPNSLFIQAIAATQGVYNSVKIKNTNAVKGVNNVDSAEVFPPNKTVNVLTTLSFAVKPVINAVDILQSPKPRGVNKGDINPPIDANKLNLESLTTFNFESKVCKNQIIIVAIKIIVNAFVIKSFALLHIN